MHRDMFSAGGSWGAGDGSHRRVRKRRGQRGRLRLGRPGVSTPGGWPWLGLAKDMSAWGCQTFRLRLYIWKWFPTLSPPLLHHSGIHDPIIDMKERSASSIQVVKGHKTKTR